MAQKIPPELEQKIIKYQQLENQLASILTQKSVVVSEIKDIDMALNVLGSVEEDTPVYKNTGFVMVKVPKENVEKELKERKEELEIRLNSYEKMEASLRQQLDDLKKELEKIRTGGYGAQPKAD